MSQSTPGRSEPIRPEIVAESARGPLRVVIEPPRTRWIGRRLLWIALCISVLLNFGLYSSYQSYFQSGTEIDEKWHSLDKKAPEKVAIIAVEGAILGEEGFVKKQIDRVREDDQVKAVVLRVDSPGGTVTGSDYIYHHLKKLAKDKQIPLVVSMGSVAASGGYYVAMAAGDKENTIYAEPTTWTGSIGVIIPHYDLSGLLEKLNVQDDSIASNPLKMMGSPTRKFPEGIRAEEQQILKGLVDSSFEGFKQIVLASRAPLRNDKSLQDVVFTGRIFTARQAKENGLVDQLGFIEDAVNRAIELAGLEKEHVRVVQYTRPVGMIEHMLFGQQSHARGIDVAALLELTAPKAYYLCTWMSGLTAEARH
ncbi:MAG: signal peptide peptidase SppA [Planctomycetia bacterium]|nr:signal peptide peptidase SppA [Planctomycetia bacterium]